MEAKAPTESLFICLLKIEQNLAQYTTYHSLPRWTTLDGTGLNTICIETLVNWALRNLKYIHANFFVMVTVEQR